jgi:hypothetical protein
LPGELSCGLHLLIGVEAVKVRPWLAVARISHAMTMPGMLWGSSATVPGFA